MEERGGYVSDPSTRKCDDYLQLLLGTGGVWVRGMINGLLHSVLKKKLKKKKRTV